MSDATLRQHARANRRTRAEVRLMSPRSRGLLKLAAALGHEGASELVEPARCGPEWRPRLHRALPEREARMFAADCAERLLWQAEDRDPRSLRAVVVSRRYARGEASAADLTTARDAAWDAWSGTWDAWSGTWDAAEAATLAAAWAAVGRSAERAWQARRIGEWSWVAAWRLHGEDA